MSDNSEWKEISDKWVIGEIPNEIYLTAVHNRIEKLEYIIDYLKEELKDINKFRNELQEANKSLRKQLKLSDDEEFDRVKTRVELQSEISRLKAEIEIYKSGLKVCNPESVLETESRYLDEISRLKADLEKSQQERDNLRSHIY